MAVVLSTPPKLSAARMSASQDSSSVGAVAASDMTSRKIQSSTMSVRPSQQSR